jgi:PQQ-like domain
MLFWGGRRRNTATFSLRRAKRIAARRRRRYLLSISGAVALVALTIASNWRWDVLDLVARSVRAGDRGVGAVTEAGVGQGAEAAPGGERRTGSPGRALYEAPKPINTGVDGLTTFRGNATRTYYGQGPVPTAPEVLWRHPESGGLCSESSDGAGTRVWCGTGWTGQPNVIESKKGAVQVRFGAYDRAVHVLDGRTGEPLKAPFYTGDLIKGTVTSDPDGYPLLYTGSRDNYFRILALDRGRSLAELWKLSADSAPNPLWNDDWDSSPLVIGDYLLEGGENSWFYVIKLNRDYEHGRVTVAPEMVAMMPGYDGELLASLGDDDVSIENSVSFFKGIVYFANSGGLVQGWDISDLLDGGDRYRRVFRFWTGDDTDASVVIDRDGYLYVASELERLNSRSNQVGQLMKLDPTKERNPIEWSIPVSGDGGVGGIWATPALYRDALFVTTNSGRLLALDRLSGAIEWQIELTRPTWSSPAVVDDVLIVGDCDGVLHAYDVRDPLAGRPDELWRVRLGGCIESTPAVWKGMVYVGSRDGGVYGIGDRPNSALKVLSRSGLERTLSPWIGEGESQP